MRRVDDFWDGSSVGVGVPGSAEAQAAVARASKKLGVSRTNEFTLAKSAAKRVRSFAPEPTPTGANDEELRRAVIAIAKARRHRPTDVL